MASWQGHCDPGLLFTFMQSLAIFPPGLLVRLRSNRLAVVLPNGRRGSRAMARAFFDARARGLPPGAGRVDHGRPKRRSRHRAGGTCALPFPDWVRLHADLMDGKYNLQAVMQRHAG